LFFRGVHCDPDYYLVVERPWKKPLVSKQATQKLDTKRFDLKELNSAEDKKEC
jgi:hypothetical protein